VSRLRIAIAGAGIGGLTAALALAHDGHDVTVIERRTGFGEPGAGIQLSPNASGILIALGLGAGLNRIGCEPNRIVIRAIGSGREIAQVALGRRMRERYGAPYIVIARADLHTLLLDAVRSRDNIRLLVGRNLLQAAESKMGAEITAETGAGARETIAADLVVGADGLWSRTRAALGDTRQPVASGFTASRAVVPAEALPREVAPDHTGLWLGPARHVVHYPIGGGRDVNIVVIERRADDRQGWSEPEPGEALVARFARAAPTLRSLLTAPESWSAWSLHDLPVRRMVGPHIALIGDAAHPVLPYLAQGGALAIEDAAELAVQLRRSEGDTARALSAYAKARTARARRVQREARRNGRIYHLSGPAAFARNLVLGNKDPSALADRYAWLYGWRPSDA
jgi:salicylate hydroxylase